MWPLGGHQCTMPYETNQRFVASAKCASAHLTHPRLQRTQSGLRKCSSSPNYWVACSQHDYVRSSAAGCCSHCEWSPVCFVFGRGHQRDDAKHYGGEHSGVASHDHDCRDLRPWNSRCVSQYSGRDNRRSWLHERRNQQHPRLDYHLKESNREIGDQP